MKYEKLITMDHTMLLLVQYSTDIRRGSAAARLLGLRVRIPPGGIDVCRECSELPGRGLCDKPSFVQRGPTKCGASVIAKPR